MEYSKFFQYCKVLLLTGYSTRVFKVSIEYILRNELNEKEEDVKSEIMRLYRSLDRYNRETWVILGKRLLGGQIQDYTEIIEKS